MSDSQPLPNFRAVPKVAIEEAKAAIEALALVDPKASQCVARLVTELLALADRAAADVMARFVESLREVTKFAHELEAEAWKASGHD